MSDSTILMGPGPAKLLRASTETPPLSDDGVAVRLAQPLRKVAVFLEAFAIVATAVGVLAGIAIAAQTSTAFGFDGTQTQHPYLVPGIAVVVFSVVSGLFSWCVARAAHVVALNAVSRRHA